MVKEEIKETEGESAEPLLPGYEEELIECRKWEYL